MSSIARRALFFQWIFYITGVSTLGVGIGFVIGANVGFGPLDIFFSHFVELFNSSFFVVKSIVSSILAIIGYSIRKEWPNNRLIGMAFNAAVTGLSIDITLTFVVPVTGLVAYAQLVLGVIVVATGINLTRLTMVKTTPLVFRQDLIAKGVSNFTATVSATMLQLPPIDFLVNAIFERVRFTYGTVKQGFDAFILTTSIFMSFFLDLPYRLGFGTILTVILIGPSINITFKLLEKILPHPAN
jgi:uncharacterized membrane protein YczE